MFRPWRTCMLALATLCVPASAARPKADCAVPSLFTIAAVGDVLLHSQLQKQALRAREGYVSLWKEIMPLLKRADVAYANLEGPAAYAVGRKGMRLKKDPGLQFDNEAYSGYPVFNYHPILATELRRAGFGIVSTANNHALDRGALGVESTIAALESANLPFMGTRTREEADDDDGDAEWHVVTEHAGWRLAWLACTFDTNGFRDPQHLVLDCFRDEERILGELRALAASPRIDAVIVTPHWGKNEYSHKVEPSQRSLARRFAEAGATAILGNHPHVTRPWEMLTAEDGRRTFVIYSIGNFVSAQRSVAKRTSALVYLTLAKGERGAKAAVWGAQYVPLWMRQRPYAVVAGDAEEHAPEASIALLERLLGKQGRITSQVALTEPAPGCAVERRLASSVERAQH